MTPHRQKGLSRHQQYSKKYFSPPVHGLTAELVFINFYVAKTPIFP